MKSIAQHVLASKAKKGEKKSFHLVFAPRRRMICERVLEEAGIYDGTKKKMNNPPAFDLF